MTGEPLERRVELRCSAAHAFAVFTGCIDAWWPPSHRRFDRSELRLEPRVGGRFYERSESGEEARLGEVLRWDPPRRVTYTWYPGAITEPTEVDVRFAPHGDHCLVEVTHAEGRSGLGDAWPQRVALFGRAWDHVLPTFVAFVHANPEAP
ncbi:MAG: SRPBCC domain-containing protein [Myxococcales bacterium]|nr:SRPBCC domain-containing protein [Myxococcales bacterium]MCB9717983.1 SRPBCC domain-containing protein [Myxococcales bacterium]